MGKKVQPALLRAPLYLNSPGGHQVSRDGGSDGGILEIQDQGPYRYAPGLVQPENIFLPAHERAEKNPALPEFSGPENFLNEPDRSVRVLLGLVLALVLDPATAQQIMGLITGMGGSPHFYDP